MAILYKTLVDVKLLHEYFLTRGDGSTIFSLSSQSARMDYLRQEYDVDAEPINQDVAFEFPASLRSTYEGLGLKIVPAYSGFRIAMRVAAATLTDGTLVFRPLVSLPPTLDISVRVNLKNREFETYTNSRVARPLPAVYFFSNADITGPKAFPFLTNPVPIQDATAIYEQGELSGVGMDIQEYYRRGGVDTWSNVVGDGFANESDRLLLPNRFDYQFSDTDNLTQVSFVLTDHDGNEVSAATLTNGSGFGRTVLLDFSSTVRDISKPGAHSVSTYSLQVSGNNGLRMSHAVLFSDELTSGRPWAVVSIRPVVADNAFKLIADDGYMIRRRDGLGVWTPAPIFEIPIKSRLAYWRFVHNRGKELNISGMLAGYVNKEGNALVTRLPRAAARSWFLLNKELSTDTQYVPNPVSPMVRIESDRRLFFDVVVPNADLFPEVP